MKLFYATVNKSKIFNMKRRLSGTVVEIVTPSDLGIVLDVEENGRTLEENASAKASAYKEKLAEMGIGMDVIAGDSGLFIEGVEHGDNPGMFVRRVDGKVLSDEEMISHYSSLSGKYGGNLKARYVTGLAMTSGGGIRTVSIADEMMILSDRPNGTAHRGNPLDTLTIEPVSGKYYNELTEDELDRFLTDFDRGCLNFISDNLADGDGTAGGIAKRLTAEGRFIMDSFDSDCRNASDINRDLLFTILRDNRDTVFGKKHHFDAVGTVDDYRRNVPLSTYDDYSDLIGRMTDGEEGVLTAYPVNKYLLSSGTVEHPHTIPLSDRAERFLNMILPKELCLADRMMRLKTGKGIPEGNILNVIAVNDYEVKGKKLTSISGTIVDGHRREYEAATNMPEETMLPFKVVDRNYMLLRFALMNRNITLIASAFAAGVCDMFAYLESRHEMLVEDIENGTIDDSVKMPEDIRRSLVGRLKPCKERADELRREFGLGFETPIAPRIWKDLRCVISICTGDFGPYADRMKRYIGDIPVDNMVYGSSESVIAITTYFGDPSYTLLPRAGFFEFIPVDGGNVCCIDEVGIDREYEMVVTNLSGLYRYRTGDVVKVVGFHNGCPCIVFRYRIGLLLNIRGEKTNIYMVNSAVKNICDSKGLVCTNFTTYTDLSGGKGRYVLFLEIAGKISEADVSEIEDIAESELESANPYYSSMVRDGLASKIEVHFLRPGSFDEYHRHALMKGRSENQIKPPKVLNSADKIEFFTSRIMF